MVRNESDIIEAFVRHNLTRLDGLFIVDHGSADDTVRILASLAREGLPVSVLANTMPGYAQVEITTLLVRHAFARTPADFVFPLDADEFIKTPSRACMEAALSTIPPRTHGLMIEDPFLADFALRYTPAGTADALPLVIAAVEQLAKLEARATADPLSV